jgi:hypothetical protein
MKKTICLMMFALMFSFLAFGQRNGRWSRPAMP